MNGGMQCPSVCLSVCAVNAIASPDPAIAPLDTSLGSLLFCSLAVLDPRVDHTMDVLSPFISVL